MNPDTIGQPGHCAADVAAYALGALEPLEADGFQMHLRSCAVCPDELTSFQQVVDDLAISAPHFDAPPALRRRVLRAVADEPRLSLSAQRERRRSWLSFPRPALALSLSTGLALVIAAVLVVTVVLPGGSSTRTVQAQVTGAGLASVHVSGGHAQLIVQHFPAPPRGQIYEVWLQHGASTYRRSALFSVTDGAVDVAGSLHGVNHVLVTAEPAGGTSQPTHKPVISAAL